MKLKMNRFLKWGGFFGLCVCMLGSAESATANNVQVALEGQLVTIFGDNLNNQIVVSQTATSDVVITGRNGTTVNGLASVRFRRVALNAMEIRMGGGDDIVTISNLMVANDLYVNLEAGNDRLQSSSLPSTIGANLTVEGGLGNEIIRLSNWQIFGDLYLDGQTGTLNSQMTGLDVGLGLTVIGDDANDAITVGQCMVGDSTSIESKKGADRITVTDFAGFDLFANTDLGNDVVTFTNVTTLEDVGVFTGGHNDRVTFLNVASGKNINVSLDIGTDSFTGTNVIAVYDAVFEGGDGVDTFTDAGVSGGEKTEIKDFEIFR